MRPSLRQRLLIILMTIVTLTWLVTVSSGYQESLHEVEELFDARLAQTAHTLLTLVNHELEEVNRVDDPSAALKEILGHEYEYELKVAFQVWKMDNRTIVLRSKGAPEEPLSEGGLGFSTENHHGTQWRVYTLNVADGHFRVQVAEDHSIRKELAGNIVMQIVTPMLIALPLLAAMLWLGIGQGLLPLIKLAKEVTHREPGNMVPMEEKDAPQETRPLIKALNELFQRLENSFKSERRFTADAAHELRTPLAAIKIQAQVAQRATTAGEKNDALAHITQGVDRMARLVEQLLTLSRADSFHSSGLEKSLVDLKEIAREVLADEAPTAISRSIELALDCDEERSFLIVGSANALSILLRNLVDNAIRYSADNSQVTVVIMTTSEKVTLSVNDTGPGIAEESRGQVLKRFKRGNNSEIPGSGLGLSIVERFAKLHGATLQLKDGPTGRGLSVQLSFPQPKSGIEEGLKNQ
jgi:two-component system sensor histidine kinase QseC